MDSSQSSAAWTLASHWPPASPFVALTALSALFILLVPNELLMNHKLRDHRHHQNGKPVQLQQPEEPPSSWIPRAIIPAEEEFACGGGPFSFTAASLISISCDRSQIHVCCEVHDLCYVQYNVSQQQCDDAFCACMDRIRHSAWCDNIAQPGLCLATRTFGHLFHWSTTCATLPADDGDGAAQIPEECVTLARQLRRLTEEGAELVEHEVVGQNNNSTATACQASAAEGQQQHERHGADVVLVEEDGCVAAALVT